MSKKNIRIGTRDSKLAVWQAETVQKQLNEAGVPTELVMIKSPADVDLSTPLHKFGSTGIFTKILDDALLAGDIDIAVHSLKDYPTLAPEGIVIPAVLERGPSQDILVYKGDLDFLDSDTKAIIATGSIRRMAQWKNRYPHHKTTGLRGNVQTRLRKLDENEWKGAIFAKAGLERIGLLPENYIILDWMISAPAQGIIGIACREKDSDIIEILRQLNHERTFAEAQIERQFLRTVEGGCSAPVGAFAKIDGSTIYFKAGVFDIDGTGKVVTEKEFKLSESGEPGIKAAVEVLNNGGKALMKKMNDA